MSTTTTTDKAEYTIAKAEIGGDASHSPGTTGGAAVALAKPSFLRSTLFQILVVGICAFTAPGI
jgi:hypothetical protein